jgi:hypothetical protein
LDSGDLRRRDPDDRDRRAQGFGVFQKLIAADLKVGRKLWSFANALAML